MFNFQFAILREQEKPSPENPAQEQALRSSPTRELSGLAGLGQPGSLRAIDDIPLGLAARTPFLTAGSQLTANSRTLTHRPPLPWNTKGEGETRSWAAPGPRHLGRSPWTQSPHRPVLRERGRGVRPGTIVEV
jgi:hypothetical protein